MATYKNRNTFNNPKVALSTVTTTPEQQHQIRASTAVWVAVGRSSQNTRSLSHRKTITSILTRKDKFSGG